ncbi:PAS domain-containing protein [Mucilaginibacter sp. UR6-11]|uniref:PAS domain-containing protein n=1 Tax=Mucilaginibacter sp. UR6-11 TaxID=1435644 RepID=UPI001E636AC2|nr:PAS domain-containing protein [Mucilaginibacter sp. UR6-11]MCC8426934.1 PAS domain S-box protein [Mucilaginibacter sp. UR6-11]
MRKLWLKYVVMIELGLPLNVKQEEGGLGFWQNQLFLTFLTYCLPISLIALLPCVTVALHDRDFAIAIVDLSAFSLLAVATFTRKLSLGNKKAFVVAILYPLAIFLIYTLGYMGPGIFYLFFLTVLIALIMPVKYAYISISVNTVVLGLFAFIIALDGGNTALSSQYRPGEWIAVSSNLIFGSGVIVMLIHRILEKLQVTIEKRDRLKERYKKIFDLSPLPMWTFDTETLRFLDVNEAATKHYGYSKKEFLTMTIKDIRSSKAVAAVEQIVTANRKSGTYYEGNSQHIKKDGSYIYVRIESNLLQMDDKQVRLVLATDITDQVSYQLEIFNATKKIRESESNLRAVFNSSIDGFVLLDAKYNIKLVNSRASGSIRFNRDQQKFEIGRSIFDFVEASRLAYFRRIIERVYLGEIIEYDRRYRGTDGIIYWIHYSLTPVYHGKFIIGACITGRDVTARKLYLKTVEEQNKTFREISWMQSHLVRAPLARLLGLIPMLDPPKNAEQDEILRFINLSATELDEIIRQVSEKSNNIIDKYPMQVNE